MPGNSLSENKLKLIVFIPIVDRLGNKRPLIVSLLISLLNQES